jgi:hypothetical protein
MASGVWDERVVAELAERQLDTSQQEWFLLYKMV